MSSGHIYIVRLKESICVKENVYKCGRTKNMFQRIKTYPLGTELLYCVQVSDMVVFEQFMLSHFRENFTSVPEMGAEYFEGNLSDMIKLLNRFLPFHLPNHHNNKDEDSQPENVEKLSVIKPVNQEKKKKYECKTSEIKNEVKMK
jgi:hypothetical protein